MEDINAWGTFISSYGFPIVCCVVMFKYLEKERETHRQEIDGMTNALNENTNIIKELRETILKVMEKKHDDTR